MEIWSNTSPTADAVPPLPLESVKGSLRSRGGSKPPPYDVKSIPCEDKSPHAQAPSVPMRRAGRRARDEARILPYALGGEKSVNGGIGTPSVAPHLHRKPLREVRSEFSWTADGAAYSDACGRGGRAARSFASFVTFLSNKEKFIKPFPIGKMISCANGSACEI